MTNDLHYATAREQAAALRSRRISAAELVEAAIGRIEALDGDINAVVVRDFDRARRAASAADTALAAGVDGALLGVPVTVKESHNVAGLATTWGVPQFEGWTAPADAAGVARLKAAGAIVLGKSNVPPFLADWQASNPLYGRTSNPWDLRRTPGGSSGGGAAALASGMVALELGSDLGGSIRVPSAFCGVLGHKPTFGLVPMRGSAPPGVDGVPPPLAVIGPLARSAGDLDLALQVLAGPGEEDSVALTLTLPPPRHADLNGFRVLVVDELPGVALDGEVRAALHDLAGELSNAGADVDRRGALPFDAGALLECCAAMTAVLTSRGAPADAPVTAHRWMDLLDEQLRLRRRCVALFESCDVVLMPAFGTVAFEHCDSQPMAERSLVIDGEPTAFGAQGAWSCLATLANLPATTVPVGTSSGGLPIGLQIVGPYLEDRTTIAFAGLLERERGGFRPPPGI